MLSRLSGSVWREEDAAAELLEEEGEEEEEEEEDAASSWRRSAAMPESSSRDDEISLPCLKSILDEDWYAAAATTSSAPFAGINPSVDPSLLLLHHHQLPPPPVVDSSSVFSSLDPSSSSSSFFPTQKPALSSFLSAVCSNPYDASSAFDYVSENPTFLPPAALPSSASAFMLGFPSSVQDLLPPMPGVSSSLLNPPNIPMGFDSFENSPFLSRGKVLRPLEIFPPVGAQPTLFQKRALLRQNSNSGVGEKGGMCLRSSWDCEVEKRRRRMMMMMNNDEDELDDASIDGSGLNYDSEDICEVADTTLRVDDQEDKNVVRGNVSVANSSLTAGGGGVGEFNKGRRKGLPAKNLMAERRRRKKLNDRLYMLRSVVPKISKMDRASILGDAIEYLKELLQRINDLHNELESTNSSMPTSSTSSFHPLTPTPPTLPCRIKEELCPSSLPSPNGQPARVEVRLREGRAVNIHMFCARRPGLLLSTMRALDGLGLDIQQAVISCFNGFALDVFRAEQSKDGPGVLPEEIKEVLLHSAGFQNAL